MSSLEGPMTRLEAIINFSTGVLLPTIDVSSDLIFAIRLLAQKSWTCWGRKNVLELTKQIPCDSSHLDPPGCDWDANRALKFESNRFLYGSISFIFPTVSFIFVTYHWWQLAHPKKGGSGRLRTLPLLLMQAWPQFRMLKMIHKGYWKQDPDWRQDQAVLAENIFSIEPFVESVPQVFWLCYLWLETRCLGPGDYYHGKYDPLGMTTAITSLFSAIYGLTNCLRVGPLKLIPNKPAAGFGHMSFHLVFWSNTFSLLTKGIVFSCLFEEELPYPGNDYRTLGRANPTAAGLLTLLLFAPQLILAIFSMIATVGLKDTARLFVRYPALFLMPVFTPFTFGPRSSKCCGLQKEIRLHHGLTAINLFITAAGIFLTGYLAVYITGITKPHCRVLLMSFYGLAAITTISLILTDICSYCSRKIKPDRETRSVDSLFAYSKPFKSAMAKIRRTVGSALSYFESFNNVTSTNQQPQQASNEDLQETIALPIRSQ